MVHEIVEQYDSREEEERVAELRRSGMEVVFGDPEDRPCELLAPARTLLHTTWRSEPVATSPRMRRWRE